MNPNFIPAYRKLPSGTLTEKAESAEEMLMSCKLCPREYQVDRTAGKRGFYKTGDKHFLSSWEPTSARSVRSGDRMFMDHLLRILQSRLPLCQNCTISHLGTGRKMSRGRIAEVMLELQQDGNNIYIQKVVY